MNFKRETVENSRNEVGMLLYACGLAGQCLKLSNKWHSHVSRIGQILGHAANTGCPSHVADSPSMVARGGLMIATVGLS